MSYHWPGNVRELKNAVRACRDHEPQLDDRSDSIIPSPAQWRRDAGGADHPGGCDGRRSAASARAPHLRLDLR